MKFMNSKITIMEHKCSYCNRKLGEKYAFNSIFVNPTIYKCKRWWCNIAVKMKWFKLTWK